MTRTGRGRAGRYWLRAGIAAVAVAALAALLLPPTHRAFALEAFHVLTGGNREETHAWVAQFGAWGPLALLGAFVLQAVIPVLPALVLVAVSSLAYGPLVGGFIVYGGTLLGAVAGYFVGRWVGSAALHALVGRRARASAYVLARRHGLRGVVLVRLMPVLSSDVVNMVAGALRLRFWPFMLATALGALPVTVLVVWLAATPQRLTWGVVALSAAVAVVAAARWLWLRWTARQGARALPE